VVLHNEVVQVIKKGLETNTKNVLKVIDMNDLDEKQMLLQIRKYALFNAVKHGMAPKAGAVIGRLVGSHPELRLHVKTVSKLVGTVVGEISKTDKASWRRELSEIAPDLLDELSEKRVPDKGLPPLECTDHVVMRFAPNPNGPATLGSARGIIVNSEYAKRYHGKFIIRFDDTDPETKRPLPDAYNWYLEDCRWLGAVPDEVVIASDHIQTYYDHARQLIKKNAAYICFCKKDEFKKYRDSATACPHREQDVDTTLKNWQDMLDGKYSPGEAVLRIKTDMSHKDPAIRDWVAFRIVDTPHPRPEIRDRYQVWPLLDFESAIEDHLLGITHIIRGKDLIDSEHRQRYVYKYFNWKYPETLHWGRVKIHEFGKLSTSSMSEAIRKGEYTGWDDPRLPTLQAMRCRGIQPEAICKFFIELGVGETDIGLSMENLYAENRKVVDQTSKRFFFTPDPVKLIIRDAPVTVAKPMLHPSHRNWGNRLISVANNVLISQSDAEKIKESEILRLKDLYNIKILKKTDGVITAEYMSGGVEIVRKNRGRIIHWTVPGGLNIRVLNVTGEEKGIGERGISDCVGEVVQFERYGFVRIDSVKDNNVTAYFAHK